MTILRSPQSRLKVAVIISAPALLISMFGPGGEPAAAGATAEASRVARVDIANFAFHPPALTIAKGGTVTFSNSSRVTHTATRNGAFDTGRIRPGKSVAVRFRQKGTFAYHCEIHPLMRGRVIVD